MIILMQNVSVRTPLLVATLLTLVLAPCGGAAQQIEKRLPAAPVRRDTVRAVPQYGVVDGVVTDTGLVPLKGAEVVIVRTSIRVPTPESGHFQITRVPEGAYILIVRLLGYRPISSIVQVPAGDTLRLAYAMERMTATLDTIKVIERQLSPRMAEFEQRRRFGVGEFMTQEELEKRAALEVRDLLRNFKTINVAPSYTKGSMPEYFALSKRGGGGIAGECAMTVVLDGMAMPTPFDLNLLPPPREVSGIEVYNGSATVPPQFSGLSKSCGVILVWTRDR
jgi:hypothetical protein